MGSWSMNPSPCRGDGTGGTPTAFPRRCRRWGFAKLSAETVAPKLLIDRGLERADGLVLGRLLRKCRRSAHYGRDLRAAASQRLEIAPCAHGKQGTYGRRRIQTSQIDHPAEIATWLARLERSRKSLTSFSFPLGKAQDTVL